MKKFLFLVLFLVVTTQSNTESESTISLFKCLLLDSDVTYNHINSLVEAITTMDPAKLISAFTTMYPAISAEVKRCKGETSEEIVVKSEEKKNAPTQDIFGKLLKLFTQYVLPILKNLGINLTQICKMIFPDLAYCDILQFL
jgi:hypothetical protein